MKKSKTSPILTGKMRKAIEKVREANFLRSREVRIKGKIMKQDDKIIRKYREKVLKRRKMSELEGGG